jgi:endonuclease YncB( thermonuclease family)
MAYRVVRGRFVLSYRGARHVGSRPDGDSVWFVPDDPARLRAITDHMGRTRDADLNDGGAAQLRFEGIDALELHYAGSNHQNAAGAVAARDACLRELGFDPPRIEYAPSGDIPTSVRSSVPESVRGHILTRAIDPFGRPVAFVFRGDAPSGGAEAWLDAVRLRASANARLLAAGQAYPAYYTGLPHDLRNVLTDLADAAWAADRGVWAQDASMTPTKIGRADLGDHTLWPKLYRRLYAYFDDTNAARVGGFPNWLRADPARDDVLWIVPDAREGNLHDVVEVDGGRLRMTQWPEDLIVRPG